MTTIAWFNAATKQMVVREMTAEEEAALATERANEPPPPVRRIMGYTIIARIEAALGPDEAKAKLAAIETADPVGYARLISAPNGVLVDDQRLLAGIAALGLDASSLLA